MKYKKRQIYVFLSVVIGILFIISLYGLRIRFSWEKDTYENYLQVFDDYQLAEMIVGEKNITVEVVISKQATKKGLMGRQKLNHDGMLFIYPQGRIPIFWMKNMLFDIDIIWINQGKVVQIDQSVTKPSPGSNDRALRRYTPDQEADMVLEVNSGKSKEWSISVGDSVHLIKK